MKKILILSDFASAYIRQLLHGFLKYSREVGSWSFYRVPLHFSDLYQDDIIVEIAKKWKADAIVGQISNINIEKLRKLDIPILLQNYNDRVSGISNITGDYWGTGTMAANFFIKKRYKNFAFYGTQSAVWSREREDGFRACVHDNGGDFYAFNEDANVKYEPVSNIEPLKSWLLSLPKPIALFACDDNFALRVSEVCRICNILVPDEIAILGVDNDEILCNMSDPPLSSIVLDVENGGYQTAKHLHRIMEHKDLPQFNIVILPVRIERRSSTEQFSISDPLVLSVIKLIEEENNVNLTMKDILDKVYVSRRVLEKRFKAAMNESIYQYILSYKVNLFADKLLTSDKLAMEIADELGLKDYTNLSKVFKRFKHMTPTEYRKIYNKLAIKN